MYRRLFFCEHIAVGCHHRRQIFPCPHGFQFGSSKVFPTGHVHARSGINLKPSFLRFFCECGWHNPLLRRWLECGFVFLFRAKRYYWQVSTRLRERIALVLQSLVEICPQTASRTDFADEDFWLRFKQAMDLYFLGCLLDAVQHSWIVLVELVPTLLCPSQKSLQIVAAQRPVIRKSTVALFSQ